MPKGLRFSIILMVAVSSGGAVFATHFTGTYVDQQNGVTVTLQQGQDGGLQGALSGPNGQFQIQGQGNQDGAYGTVMSTQGVLGFQAQLSPDGAVLQLEMYQMGQNNQPVSVGSLTLRRAQGSGGPPNVAGQPGMGQPGMGQPGMGQPGMGQPGMGQPGPPGVGQPGMGQMGMVQPGMTGMGQPGMSQPGMPGMSQPGMPGTGAPGMPGAGQPGMPGMAAPGMPGMNQPGVPGMGDPAAMPPPGGYPAMQQFAGWNGSYIGNGGQLTMFVQPNQQGYYEGYFDVSGQGRFPLQAQAQGPVLEGVYVVNGGQYGFYAEFYDGYVYLIEEIDGSEYMLEPAGHAAPGSSQWPAQFPPQQPGIPGDAP